MTPPLTYELRAGFVRFLSHSYGLRFTGTRAPALDHAVWRVCSSLEVSADAVLRGVLLGDSVITSELLEKVTVGETYFFRELRHFEWLKIYLKQTRSPVHLWSAGCASGEEAYTMAIVALEALGPSAHQHVRISATDLNPAALVRARQAEYRDWSFRSVPPMVKDRWFVRKGDRYAPRDETQRLVSFRPFNLASGSLEDCPQHANVIFCRNVITYLSPRAVSNASQRLARALVPDGLLICASGDPKLSPELFRSLPVRDFSGYRHTTAPRAKPVGLTNIAESAEPEWRHSRRVRRRGNGPTIARVVPPADTLLAPPPRAPVTAPLLALARAVSNVSEAERAVKQLNDALKAAPADATLYLLRAQVYQQIGAHQLVTRDARRALLLSPQAVYAHALIALSSLANGNHSQAKRAIANGRRSLQNVGPTGELGFCDGLTSDDLEGLFNSLDQFSALRFHGDHEN